MVALLLALPGPVSPSSVELGGEPGVELKVDPGTSEARFVLKATGHKVFGTGAVLHGGFTVVPSENLLTIEGEVYVRAADLDTDNERRDRKMRDTTLAVEEHPRILFRPREARGSYPEGLRADPGTFEMVLAGEIELRGLTDEIELPVTVRFEEDRIVVDGTFPIRFEDHEIPDPSVFFLRVKKFVDASFHLEATRAPAL